MKITNCLHPIRVYNKYTDSYQYVPCGKCSSCLNIKQHDWVSRLHQESQLHKYTVFFTLTYDKECIPKFVKHDDLLVLAPRKYRTLSTSGELVESIVYDGICFPISELNLSDKRDYRYFNRYDYFTCGSVTDIQKFVKRVRYYIYELFKDTEKKEERRAKSRLRYYIVQEFGGLNHTAHYHGLFFFDSPEIAASINEIIGKSWLLCDRSRINIQFSDAKSSSYVAKYCQKFDTLPSVYRHSALRPFAVFSKRPFIGHDRLSMQQIRQIVLETKLYSVKFDCTKSKTIVTLHERSFINRYLPRCYGYSLLSPQSRNGLYSCVSRWQVFDFGQFKEYVGRLLEGYSQSDDVSLFQFIKLRTEQFFPDNSLAFDSLLYRIYCTSYRIERISRWLDIPVVVYCQKIQDFWSALDMYHLSEQYKYMIDYSESWKHNNLDDLELLFPDSCPLYELRLPKVSEYVGLESMTSKMLDDLRKNKDRKNYKRIHEFGLKFRVY